MKTITEEIRIRVLFMKKKSMMRKMMMKEMVKRMMRRKKKLGKWMIHRRSRITRDNK